MLDLFELVQREFASKLHTELLSGQCRIAQYSSDLQSSPQTLARLHHPLAKLHKFCVCPFASIFYSNSRDCIKLSKLYLNFKRTDDALNTSNTFATSLKALLVPQAVQTARLEAKRIRDKSIHCYLLCDRSL